MGINPSKLVNNALKIFQLPVSALACPSSQELADPQHPLPLLKRSLWPGLSATHFNCIVWRVWKPQCDEESSFVDTIHVCLWLSLSINEVTHCLPSKG